MTISIRVGGEPVAIISRPDQKSAEKAVKEHIEYYRERYQGERITTKEIKAS